jgi:SAM-dependent methyltransferase
LALFIIRHEIRGEKQYGVKTVGVDDLTNSVTKEKRRHASVYQPINYYTAEQLFDQLFLEDVEGTLLDLGCGKGRVFGIGAAYDFKHIVGVEFSEKLCLYARETAQEVIAQYEGVKVEVVCQDASAYPIPAEVSTIFMFNPFDATIMQQVVERIDETQQLHPRNIKILYANPVCKKVLLEAGFVETFHFRKMTYLEGSVLEREA